MDWGRGHPSRVPFEYGVHCVIVLTLVQVFGGCAWRYPHSLYDDNLKCVSSRPEALLSAAWFTNLYVSLVGQEAAPCKCVLLSTSRKVRTDMASWMVTRAGDTWSVTHRSRSWTCPFLRSLRCHLAVKLDVRDLGGHLDLTYRARASTLGGRIVWSFRSSPGCLRFADHGGTLRILRTMYIPAALHVAEASHVSAGTLWKLRTAFVRAVWSGRLP